MIEQSIHKPCRPKKLCLSTLDFVKFTFIFIRGRTCRGIVSKPGQVLQADTKFLPLLPLLIAWTTVLLASSAPRLRGSRFITQFLYITNDMGQNMHVYVRFHHVTETRENQIVS